MAEREMETETELQRFVDAQDHNGAYAQALAELNSGHKTGHWIWFIFPQIAGIGSSEMSRMYAIRSQEEADAYLNDPVLGARLVESARALERLPGNEIVPVMGELDALKLRSSMTLFARATNADPVFARVLDKYFEGTADPVTERLIAEKPI